MAYTLNNLPPEGTPSYIFMSKILNTSNMEKLVSGTMDPKEASELIKKVREDLDRKVVPMQSKNFQYLEDLSDREGDSNYDLRNPQEKRDFVDYLHEGFMKTFTTLQEVVDSGAPQEETPEPEDEVSPDDTHSLLGQILAGLESQRSRAEKFRSNLNRAFVNMAEEATKARFFDPNMEESQEKELLADIQKKFIADATQGLGNQVRYLMDFYEGAEMHPENLAEALKDSPIFDKIVGSKAVEVLASIRHNMEEAQKNTPSDARAKEIEEISAEMKAIGEGTMPVYKSRYAPKLHSSMTKMTKELSGIARNLKVSPASLGKGTPSYNLIEHLLSKSPYYAEMENLLTDNPVKVRRQVDLLRSHVASIMDMLVGMIEKSEESIKGEMGFVGNSSPTFVRSPVTKNVRVRSTFDELEKGAPKEKAFKPLKKDFEYKSLVDKKFHNVFKTEELVGSRAMRDMGEEWGKRDIRDNPMNIVRDTLLESYDVLSKISGDSLKEIELSINDLSQTAIEEINILKTVEGSIPAIKQELDHLFGAGASTRLPAGKIIAELMLKTQDSSLSPEKRTEAGNQLQQEQDNLVRAEAVLDHLKSLITRSFIDSVDFDTLEVKPNEFLSKLNAATDEMKSSGKKEYPAILAEVDPDQVLFSKGFSAAATTFISGASSIFDEFKELIDSAKEALGGLESSVKDVVGKIPKGLPNVNAFQLALNNALKEPTYRYHITGKNSGPTLPEMAKSASIVSKLNLLDKAVANMASTHLPSIEALTEHPVFLLLKKFSDDRKAIQEESGSDLMSDSGVFSYINSRLSSPEKNIDSYLTAYNQLLKSLPALVSGPSLKDDKNRKMRDSEGNVMYAPSKIEALIPGVKEEVVQMIKNSWAGVKKTPKKKTAAEVVREAVGHLLSGQVLKAAALLRKVAKDPGASMDALKEESSGLTREEVLDSLLASSIPSYSKSIEKFKGDIDDILKEVRKSTNKYIPLDKVIKAAKHLTATIDNLKEFLKNPKDVEGKVIPGDRSFTKFVVNSMIPHLNSAVQKLDNIANITQEFQSTGDTDSYSEMAEDVQALRNIRTSQDYEETLQAVSLVGSASDSLRAFLESYYRDVASDAGSKGRAETYARVMNSLQGALDKGEDVTPKALEDKLTLVNKKLATEVKKTLEDSKDLVSSITDENTKVTTKVVKASYLQELVSRLREEHQGIVDSPEDVNLDDLKRHADKALRHLKEVPDITPLLKDVEKELGVKAPSDSSGEDDSSGLKGLVTLSSAKKSAIEKGIRVLIHKASQNLSGDDLKEVSALSGNPSLKDVLTVYSGAPEDSKVSSALNEVLSRWPDPAVRDTFKEIARLKALSSPHAWAAAAGALKKALANYASGKGSSLKKAVEAVLASDADMIASSEAANYLGDFLLKTPSLDAEDKIASLDNRLLNDSKDSLSSQKKEISSEVEKAGETIDSIVPDPENNDIIKIAKNAIIQRKHDTKNADKSAHESMEDAIKSAIKAHALQTGDKTTVTVPQVKEAIKEMASHLGSQEYLEAVSFLDGPDFKDRMADSSSLHKAATNHSAGKRSVSLGAVNNIKGYLGSLKGKAPASTTEAPEVDPHLELQKATDAYLADTDKHYKAQSGLKSRLQGVNQKLSDPSLSGKELEDSKNEQKEILEGLSKVNKDIALTHGTWTSALDSNHKALETSAVSSTHKGGHPALSSYASELMSSLIKKRKQKADLLKDTSDPSNAQLASSLSRDIDRDIKKLIKFHGNPTLGIKGDTTALADEAKGHYEIKAQKENDRAQAIAKYYKNKVLNPAMAEEIRKTQGLPENPDLQEAVNSSRDAFYKASSLNPSFKLRGGSISGDLPEDAVFGTGSGRTDSGTRKKVQEDDLQDMLMTVRKHVEDGKVKETVQERRTQGDVDPMRALKEHQIDRRMEEKKWEWRNAPTISTKMGGGDSRYIIEEAQELLQNWIHHITSSGHLKFSADEKTIQSFLGKYKEKMLNRIRRDYKEQYLEGGDFGGIRVKGSVNELKEQIGYWEKVVDGLNREEKESTEAIHGIMDALAQAEESNSSVADVAKGKIEGYYAAMDKEAENQENAKALEEAGVAVETDNEGNQYAAGLVPDLSGTLEVANMDQKEYKHTLLGLQAKLKDMSRGRTSGVAHLSDAERAILGPKVVDELEDGPAAAKGVLDEHANLFRDYPAEASSTINKLHKLSKAKAKGGDLNEELSKEGVEFSEEDYSLMGSHLAGKVRDIITGNAHGGRDRLNEDFTKIVTSRAKSMEDKHQLSTARSLSEAADKKHLIFASEALEDIQFLRGNYQDKMSELKETLSEGLISQEVFDKEAKALSAGYQDDMKEARKQLTKALNKEKTKKGRGKWEHADLFKGSDINDGEKLEALSNSLNDLLSVSRRGMGVEEKSAIARLQGKTDRLSAIKRNLRMDAYTDPTSLESAQEEKKTLEKEILLSIRNLRNRDNASTRAVLDGINYRTQAGIGSGHSSEDMDYLVENSDSLLVDLSKEDLDVAKRLKNVAHIQVDRYVGSKEDKKSRGTKVVFRNIVKNFIGMHAKALESLVEAVDAGVDTKETREAFSSSLADFDRYIMKYLSSYASPRDKRIYDRAKKLDAASPNLNSNTTAEHLAKAEPSSMNEGFLKTLMAKSDSTGVDKSSALLYKKSAKKTLDMIALKYVDLISKMDKGEISPEEVLKMGVLTEAQNLMGSEYETLRKEHPSAAKSIKDSLVSFSKARKKVLTARVEDLANRVALVSKDPESTSLVSLSREADLLLKTPLLQDAELKDGSALKKTVMGLKDALAVAGAEHRTNMQGKVDSISSEYTQMVQKGFLFDSFEKFQEYQKETESLIHKIKNLIPALENTNGVSAIQFPAEVTAALSSNPSIPPRLADHMGSVFNVLNAMLYTLSGRATKDAAGVAPQMAKQAMDSGDTMGYDHDQQNSFAQNTQGGFKGIRQEVLDEEGPSTYAVSHPDIKMRNQVFRALKDGYDYNVKHGGKGRSLQQTKKDQAARDPFNQLGGSTELVDKLGHRLQETQDAIQHFHNGTRISYGHSKEFDTLASQAHASMHHAKDIAKMRISDDNHEVKFADKAQKSVNLIQKRWKEAVDKEKATLGMLDKSIGEALKGGTTDPKALAAMQKRHKQTKENVAKADDLNSQGANYKGDATHTMLMELHKTAFELQKQINKVFNLLEGKGGEVSGSEVMKQLMEADRQLSERQAKSRNMREHAEKMIDTLSDRLMQEKEYLNHAKENNGDGLTKDLENHWTNVYMGYLMHWVFWVWERNKGTFEKMYNARTEDFEEFVKAHQKNLGVFNNSRVSKAIIFTQELLESPFLKRGKYRTAEQKELVKKLLDDRRKLFLYKYSLTHLDSFMSGLEDFMKADGIKPAEDVNKSRREAEQKKAEMLDAASGAAAELLHNANELSAQIPKEELEGKVSEVAPAATEEPTPKVASQWAPKKASLVDKVLGLYAR